MKTLKDLETGTSKESNQTPYFLSFAWFMVCGRFKEHKYL